METSDRKETINTKAETGRLHEISQAKGTPTMIVCIYHSRNISK